ncbi:MAG TPA: transcriptional repressor [Mycobacteriales bacterium]|nr:transcriptional repressor [Mycobacteriales bacterium]
MSASVTRSTPQRRAVLEVVSRSDDHPTAAEVFDRVSEILPGVGPATIYRTLGLLVESGQILELRIGQSPMRYDRNVERHDHLICNSCGSVVDVHLPLDRRQSIDPLVSRHDFRVTGYDLRIHGECAKCRASHKKGRKASG